MGKLLKRNLMFVFNLVLFFQLYSYHKFKVEATDQERCKTCVESNHQYGSNTNNEKSKGNSQIPKRKRPARLIPVQLLM